MSTRFKFFFTEAIRSLSTNVATSAAATLTMILALLVVGSILIMIGSLQSETQSIQDDAGRVKVFLQETATEEQVNALREQLQKMPEVETVTFVSKADALNKAKKLFKENPEVIKNLPDNPFPASLEAKLKDASQVKVVASRMEGQPGVQVEDGVTFGGKTTERVVEVTRVVSLIFLALGIGLIIAGTLLVSNTIRLSIFSRRREIEVMKLVGASNAFVRLPFMIEGFLCGLFAAVITVLILVVGGVALEPLWRVLKLGNGPNSFNPQWVFLGLLVMGCGLGSLGSGLTIRKYLRI